MYFCLTLRLFSLVIYAFFFHSGCVSVFFFFKSTVVICLSQFLLDIWGVFSCYLQLTPSCGTELMIMLMIFNDDYDDDDDEN